LWIDNTRGVAIVLVVVGHVIQFGSHSTFDIFTNPFFVTIYAFHMPLFAFISGYLGVSSLQRLRASAIIRTRSRSLLVPFAAWTVVVGGVSSVLTQLAQGGIEPARLAKGVVRDFVYPDGSLWFLWFLFMSYALMSLAIRMRRYLGEASILISVALVYAIPFGDALVIYELKWLYPFFVAGYFVHRWKAFFRRIERLSVAGAGIAFVVLLACWTRDSSVYVSHMAAVDGDVLRTLLRWCYQYALGITGVIASVGTIRAISRRVQVPLAAALGRASLGIYCVQTYLVAVLPSIASPTGSPLFYGVYVAVVATCIMAVSYFVTTLVLERVRVLRVVMLGGR
jgi:fucose 4-O-acetylase-like acetyltransferase